MDPKSDQLSARVREWLQRQGYPFELWVGREFAKAGFVVNYAQLYQDPRSGKTREMDVHATIFNVPTKNEGIVGLTLAVECKVQRDKPWVTFASPTRAVVKYLGGSLSPSAAGATALDEFHLDTKFTVALEALDPAASIGHGMARVNIGSRTRGPNTAYAALRGAAAAAAGLAKTADDWVADTEPGLGYLDIVVPVVALDGTLFELSLDEQGNDRLLQIGGAQVLCPHPRLPARSLLVHVVTRDAIAGFIQNLVRDHDSLCEKLLGRVREVSTYARNRILAERGQVDRSAAT